VAVGSELISMERGRPRSRVGGEAYRERAAPDARSAGLNA